MSSIRFNPVIVVLVLAGAAVGLGSCAETSIDVGNYVDGGAPPSFTASDATADGAISPQSPRALCVATACPAPYATCGDGYQCGTNLSNDENNCGACGKVCPEEFENIHLTSTCVNGVCEPACAKTLLQGAAWNFADCNKILEDGCEINTSTDANNCGSCGNECPAGVACIDGKCGCDPGLIECEGACIDARNNDDNCGACGNACAWPTDAEEPPPNMVYGCLENQCGQLKCYDMGGDRWADCDGLRSNGCEIYTGISPPLIDPNHCGSCDKKCAPDQFCADTDLDFEAECGCTKPNETRCGSLETYDLGCHDLLNDVDNCGTCAAKCPRGAPHTTFACRKGLCEFDCEAGWGDCNLDPRDGCEINLLISSSHCGACGARCDTQAGQPCIDGACAMTECDAGAGPQ